MQITEFLQKHLASCEGVVLAYQSGIRAHFDALLRQLWPEGGVLVISDAAYREYVEREFLPALGAHGVETAYCLCLPTPGVSMRAQIEETLGDGVIQGLKGIVSLGDGTLFAAARERAGALGLSCCGLLNAFAPRDTFDACGDDPDAKGCADAVFFDLDAICEALHGDVREAIVSLEVEVYALKADVAAAQAMGAPSHAGVTDALQEAVPPRIPGHAMPTEDDLAQLAEAFAWYAAALRLWHVERRTSVETVLDYASACNEFPKFSWADHARLMAQIFDAVTDIEDLEISPESCANRQPPKEILTRTLQQILLEDGVDFDWLRRANDNYVDRNALRLGIHSVSLQWDPFCARLRAIADMMRAISAQSAPHADEELDPSLKKLWVHAARFASKHSFLKLFHDMGLVESSLYL